MNEKTHEEFITENNKCPFNDMDNQKCHAYNNGECMNGIVCDKGDKSSNE